MGRVDEQDALGILVEEGRLRVELPILQGDHHGVAARRLPKDLMQRDLPRVGGLHRHEEPERTGVVGVAFLELETLQRRRCRVRRRVPGHNRSFSITARIRTRTRTRTSIDQSVNFRIRIGVRLRRRLRRGEEALKFFRHLREDRARPVLGGGGRLATVDNPGSEHAVHIFVRSIRIVGAVDKAYEDRQDLPPPRRRP